MSNTNKIVGFLLTLGLALPAFGDEEQSTSTPDEVAKLKDRIAKLEAELAKVREARIGFFGFHELLPSLEAGKLPKAQAKQLAQSKVPDVKTAKQLAFQSYFKARGGFGANQSLRVNSLFPIAVSIDDFADSGDLIWEVRIEGFLGTSGVHQVTWINAINGKVRPLIPIGEAPKTPTQKNDNPPRN